jgi:NhaP-type Na+/H+ or K+/H+ antiporter
MYVWALVGGLLIGSLLGTMIGWLVVYLRTHHQEAVGLDEFLSLGLVALAYGVAQLAYASGFLAVLAAGLALQRTREHSRKQKAPIKGSSRPAGQGGSPGGCHPSQPRWRLS